MKRALTYCDYNAGAPIRPEAAEAVVRALEAGGNPSSVHGAGRRARALVEDARETRGERSRRKHGECCVHVRRDRSAAPDNECGRC